MKVTLTERLELDPGADFFITGEIEKLVYCASPRVSDARSRLGKVATVVDGGQLARWHRADHCGRGDAADADSDHGGNDYAAKRSLGKRAVADNQR